MQSFQTVKSEQVVLSAYSQMATLRWEPDIVVGIDFGMTCTGESYGRSSCRAMLI